MELRPYQNDLVEDLRGGYRAGITRQLAVSPTGSGKTVLFAFITKNAAEKQQRVFIVAHRREILDQISATLTEVGVKHGFVQAGKSPMNRPVMVASVQTLARRMDTVEEPDLVIVDEAHHSVSATYIQMFARWQKARFLGVTATPERLDGSGLGTLFQRMTLGPSVSWLIREGFLAKPVYYAPRLAPPDLSGIGMVGGDFNKGKLADALDRPAITGDAVKHYQRLCPGQRAVAFCVSVAHAQHVAQRFNDAGIPATHIDGGMEEDVRRQTVADLKSGKVLVLTSCELISEGFDLPTVNAAILLRPTASLSMHLQQLGRALRMFPGKTCLASGTKILTQRGLVEIEKINLRDKLWDGNSWVTHKGVVSKGFRHVITYQGLTATPDHQVWTQKGWRSFGECASKQIAIVKTGFGGTPIRFSENHLPGIEVGREKVESEDSCNGTLRDMLNGAVDFAWEFATRPNQWMQEMQSAGQVPEMDLSKDAGSPTKMPEPASPILGLLRRAWNYIRFSNSSRCGFVGSGKSWDSKQSQSGGDRPDRQRTWIRSRKSQVVNTDSKSIAHTGKTLHCNDALVQNKASNSAICGCDSTAHVFDRNDGASNSKTVGNTVMQTQRQVWDILNSGPRNCFTAENLLVHNCATILDHAGNCMRHGLAEQDREWSLEGKGKRKQKEKLMEVKTCPECFAIYGGPQCPQCQHRPEPKARETEEVDGELHRVTAEDFQKMAEAVARRREEGACRTLEDWQELGRERGHKPGWAWFRFNARKAKVMA